MMYLLRVFFFLQAAAFALEIDTFYGPLTVEEPILLELIESPAFQRLKHIHQYGVAYYTTHKEQFTRYDHSLGVFALLRMQNLSLEEQIAGLLHDVSHTIFSHVGDWIFHRQMDETDYQTLTHADYLEQSGLSDILRKYGYTAEQILPKQELFPALEQPLPNLCADRLDYNLQGAYHQGYITREEAIRVFEEIRFENGEWISEEVEILKKLVRFSLYMTEHCWGSGTEYVLSLWLAEAILQGLQIDLITMNDIRFGTDQEIWDRLTHSPDPKIQNNMKKIFNPYAHHRFVAKEKADLFIRLKFRGINPAISIEGTRVDLLSTDPSLTDEFQTVKNRMTEGWGIEF